MIKMDSLNVFACLSVCLLYILHVQLVSSSHDCSCEFTKPSINLKHISQHALSMEQFETHVAEKWMSRFYRVYKPSPTSTRVRDTNRRDKFVKTESEPDTYTRVTKHNQVDDATCDEAESPDYVNIKYNNAIFYKNSRERYMVFLSTCPSSYVITIDCDPIQIRTGFKKCPVENLEIGIFIREDVAESPDYIPWYDISKYLHHLTGIEIGCGGLYWDYSYGETTNC